MVVLRIKPKVPTVVRAPRKVSDRAMIGLFDALGDDTRYKLIKTLLKKNSICVSELAHVVGISAAGTSQHLKILESAGLIRRERRGQKICYQPNRELPEHRRLYELIAASK